MPAISVCLLLILSFVARPAIADADLSGYREDADAKRADVEKAAASIVEQTNAFRKEQGLEAVKVNERLADAARKFAAFMAKELKYGHEADGKTPAERAAAAKYDYSLVLENIAYQFRSDGFSTDQLAADFTVGWQNSPGHRKNMLDPDILETGVAVARSENGIYFAVQMFGRPKTAMIEITVMNKSRKPIRYKLGDQSFDLRARGGRSHGMGRPPVVAFELPPGSKQPDPADLIPRKATTYTITDGPGDTVIMTVR